MIGADGLLSGPRQPRIIVDCSSVGAGHLGPRARGGGAAGVQFLAAPVSGNPHVVADGEAVMIASGPRATYDVAEPYLRSIVRTSVWAGEDEQARLVKICHNLYLGLLVQSLSEVTTLAEKSGVPRGRVPRFPQPHGAGHRLGAPAHAGPARAGLDADLHHRAAAQGLRPRAGRRAQRRGLDAADRRC